MLSSIAKVIKRLVLVTPQEDYNLDSTAKQFAVCCCGRTLMFLLPWLLDGSLNYLGSNIKFSVFKTEYSRIVVIADVSTFKD